MYTLWTDFKQDHTKYKDITHLDMKRSSSMPLDMTDVKLFASIISADDCKINHLICDTSWFDSVETVLCFIDIIALNKTITNLDFHMENQDWIVIMHHNKIVNQIAIAIKNHASIKSISFERYFFGSSFYYLIHSIPKTIKHLGLKNSKLASDDVQFVLLNTKLQSLNIENSSSLNIKKIGWAIKINTSLVDFKYAWNDIYRPDAAFEIVNSMLTRNRNAWNASRQAALTLLAIRAFKTDDYPYFYWIPKELVIMMAKQIFESYHEPIWHNMEN